MSTTSTTGFDGGRSLSYAGIEGMASHVRQVLGLSPIDSVPGLVLFEGLRKYRTSTSDGREYQLDYAVIDLPDGIEAETRLERGSSLVVVAMASSTYDLLEAEYPRARFCLCHEIGHAVCHCDLLLKLSGIPHHQAALMRGTSEHPVYRDTEWHANAFAGALLMPAQGLLRLQVEAGGTLLPSMLQDTYAVSREAADIRLSLWNKHQPELLKGGSLR